ncbi:MAG: hypothetical protein KatS3mg114_0649 [Planctomycetaceae bacterium]|nr:MAG: hypothetical protein KatS3mg114_0649 [Planctomycetaceae bacterium]
MSQRAASSQLPRCPACQVPLRVKDPHRVPAGWPCPACGAALRWFAHDEQDPSTWQVGLLEAAGDTTGRPKRTAEERDPRRPTPTSVPSSGGTPIWWQPWFVAGLGLLVLFGIFLASLRPQHVRTVRQNEGPAPSSAADVTGKTPGGGPLLAEQHTPSSRHSPEDPQPNHPTPSTADETELPLQPPAAEMSSHPPMVEPGVSSDPLWPPAPVPPPTPPPIQSHSSPAPPGDQPMIRWQQRLQQRVVSFHVPQPTSRRRLLLIVEELLGSRVVLAEAEGMADLEMWEQPIQFSLEQPTLADILHELLKQTGWGWRIDEDKLVLSRQSNPMNPSR